jgi:hypothetical protein
MDTMLNRVIRAAMLDGELYKEVEADASLTQEALIVVILVSVVSSIGGLIVGIIGGKIGAALIGAVVAIVLGVVNYYIWSYVTYFVGTRMFDGVADPGELLRVLGYASGPRLLGILSFIPCLGGLASLIGALWALVTGFIAVREALDLDTTKTVFTVVIGWVIVFVISMVISMVLGTVLGIGAVGLGAIGSILGGGR